MRIAATTEDFVVDEIPLFAPSGEGGHTFVRIEKRGRTTEEVARLLARLAGVPHADIGYAGRKDKHAVTTQWFSAPASTLRSRSRSRRRACARWKPWGPDSGCAPRSFVVIASSSWCAS